MILCATCGKENSAAGSFCTSCGADLLASSGPRTVTAAPAGSPSYARSGHSNGPPPSNQSCPRCNALIPAGFAFCGSCGAAVETTARSATMFFHQDAPGPRPRLVGIEADGTEGAVWALDESESFAGRSAGPILLASDEYVSPKHCRFFFQGNRLHVQDLESLNGVYRRVRGEISLSPGDQLRLGRQLLRIEPMEPAPPQTTEGTRMWGSPDPGYRARLIQLLEGGGHGEVFPLEVGDNLIGREQGDVTFPLDRFVSGRHAVISVASEGVRIRDLGSSNGTFVRLRGPTPLDPGDAILLGGQLLRVELR